MLMEPKAAKTTTSLMLHRVHQGCFFDLAKIIIRITSPISKTIRHYHALLDMHSKM